MIVEGTHLAAITHTLQQLIMHDNCWAGDLIMPVSNGE